MWVLGLGWVVLAAARACVFCRLPAHDLWGRLEKICSGTGVQWEACGASRYFSAFALDGESLDRITEKTHRVLRVMEIKGSFFSLPLYWEWLRNTKIPEYTREALCAPTCPEVRLCPAGGSTTLYNCSTCSGMDVLCWPRKRCFPGSHDLWEARILLLSIFAAGLLLGILSLVVESHQLQAKRGL
ncbi:sperm-egg fusion protein TMEM95 isoform X1 [Echinops telfairi]|uniref:Sperm-egg fusion protein TMEM95 isoform X1 n=1 Tax=Echinops telfairi TaxID=9371 RepID=A0ABM1VKT3_ECHTE|nr:sperm-egg fusion protein TMEM95 isoform X1 [Echinops telfairi]